MTRILIMLDHRENRRLLAQLLEKHHYRVLLGDAPKALKQSFDLCIMDGPALEHLRGWARSRKQAEHPVLLPFLLVTPRQGVELITRELWKTVDEAIVTPIEKAELLARVEILLRTRLLSQENARLLHQLEQELVRAAEVQSELLPRVLPALPGFELAARCRPAREVGGDFYDWQEVAPDRITLTLGDAMGKGMPAALLMATVRAALRAVAPRHSPAAALELVRGALEADLLHSSSFVTLLHAQLDVSTRRLWYVDAGHAHHFVRHADGRVEKLQPTCPALGIPSYKRYIQSEFVFQPGDLLVIYSDGLTDRQPEAALDHAALAAALADCPSAQAVVDRLMQWGGAGDDQVDDVTALALLCRA